MDHYLPDKNIWDHHDFKIMGWHDATIWSMVADTESFEFLIDLDYIFKWVDPGPGETYYKFWVAPVTMVFENAFDVRVDIQSPQGDMEISALHCTELVPSPNGKFTQYKFCFECQEGGISLQATGYKMYIRQSPTLLDRQSLGFLSRGGVSFDRSVSNS